jgi:tetratricopeptide (TPR) repeat protein
MLSAPIYTMVRFGRWEDALDEPEPDQRLPLAIAMWHYARGMAFAALNRTDQATLELRELFKVASGKAVRERYTDFRGPETVRHLLDVAREQLMSQIAESRGDHEGRVEHLERAVAAEDELGYSEPPLWFFPLRQALGIALLRAGDAERAEKVLREDLERFPRNGWSLYGLSLALSAQKSPEARRARDEFETAWSYADIMPEDIPF